MDGPSILARTLSVPNEKADRFGNHWQYHSRSDRHSKVACWSVLFELMQHSSQLRRHIAEGRVVFGVNQEMRDYVTNRTKDLDLVVATRIGGVPPTETTLSDLADRWSVVLSDQQRKTLAQLPGILEGPTGMVLVALEAKATMTAHIKALPRLFDELNSSHATVHANTSRALAAGFAMVNVSPTFVSADLNKIDLAWHGATISRHSQPLWAERAVAKLRDIPRRSNADGFGFDAFGIVLVDMANDGSPVHVSQAPPAPTPADVDHYDQMIYRLAHGYDTAFGSL